MRPDMLSSAPPCTLPLKFLMPPPAWREPNKRQARRFSKALTTLVDHAVANGLRVHFYRFTSRRHRFGPDAEVMADLKAQWSLFIQKEVWRRVVGAIWVFADHERPHIHLVAVLPASLPVNELRSKWCAGFTYAKPVDTSNYTRLGLYLAAQQRPRSGNGRSPHRNFGVRLPRSGA